MDQCAALHADNGFQILIHSMNSVVFMQWVIVQWVIVRAFKDKSRILIDSSIIIRAGFDGLTRKFLVVESNIKVVRESPFARQECR